MKFIIRDDDVNYLYNPSQLKQWYDGIIDRCPISICAVPYMKGDFFKWVDILERHKPFDKEAFYKDDVICKIGDNQELVALIKEWIMKHKVSVSLHGYHHRNPNKNAKEVRHNYITGAEFYTNDDISSILKDGLDYLSQVFGYQVSVCTAPQNMISKVGFKSILEIGANICVDLPPLRSPMSCISVYGVLNYLRLLFFWLKPQNRKKHYPYIVSTKTSKIISLYRLQPQVLLQDLFDEIDRVYQLNGIFVLNTHSYGFDYKMNDGKYTMKEALIQILEYLNKYPDIQYTTLEDLFQE